MKQLSVGSSGAYGGDGAVYELTPSNGSWAEDVINSFGNGNDGAIPTAGVTFDKAGNLYGTTSEGGSYTVGTVYELTPSASGWTENLLYSFQRGPGGYYPYGGLISDPSGNLYGTTTWGGNNGGGGTVFELTPSGGNWTFVLLYALSGGEEGGPYGNLVMDVAGNLYGTTFADGAFGYGSVFELMPQANGSWTYVDLHDFAGGSDGKEPYGDVALDANGNLYGTASEGGAYPCNGQGCGVVWEITP